MENWANDDIRLCNQILPLEYENVQIEEVWDRARSEIVTSRHSEILVGYRGQTFMDSGYFFCPYIPLVDSPPVVPLPEYFEEPDDLEKVNWVEEGF